MIVSNNIIVKLLVQVLVLVLVLVSQVGRDHAGTYVCSGHTDQARHRVRDMVEVVVQCKYSNGHYS